MPSAPLEEQQGQDSSVAGHVLMGRSQSGFLLQADGDHRYDARKSVLLWTIDLIDDSNKNGSMEFVVPATSDDSFFPVDCSFHATKTLCQVKIESVTNTQSGTPIKYALQSELTTDSYQVV